MRKLLLLIVAIIAVCVSCTEQPITEVTTSGTRSHQQDNGTITIQIDTAYQDTLTIKF